MGKRVASFVWLVGFEFEDFFPFGDRVSLCNPSWPRTCYVDQAGNTLEFTAVYLPLNAGIKGMHYHTQTIIAFATNGSGIIGYPR